LSAHWQGPPFVDLSFAGFAAARERERDLHGAASRARRWRNHVSAYVSLVLLGPFCHSLLLFARLPLGYALLFNAECTECLNSGSRILKSEGKDSTGIFLTLSKICNPLEDLSSHKSWNGYILARYFWRRHFVRLSIKIKISNHVEKNQEFNMWYRLFVFFPFCIKWNI